ncbi:hypothetical protein J6590_020855 [Homalodisca vitripennis]|nr:hypothetical protein J6590_020855 [Homalodisca vitripennis]
MAISARFDTNSPAITFSSFPPPRSDSHVSPSYDQLVTSLPEPWSPHLDRAVSEDRNAAPEALHHVINGLLRAV